MALLFIPRRTSDLFTWQGNLGVCEHSDMGRGSPEIGGRVYDDACDYGFDLKSERTGVTLLMTEAGADERDGEVMGWRFRATARVLETHGKRTLIHSCVPEVEVLVIND